MYLLIAAYSWSKNSYILFPQIFADMQMLSFSDTQEELLGGTERYRAHVQLRPDDYSYC